MRSMLFHFLRLGIFLVMVLSLTYNRTADHWQSDVSGQWSVVSRKRQSTTGDGQRTTGSRERPGGEVARYDQPGEAHEFFLLKRLPPSATVLPVEKYLTARERLKRMPRYSTALGVFLPSPDDEGVLAFEAAAPALGTWTPLGPGNIGGRTRALLIDPTNPNTMYAAGVAGGVWKTTNAGAAWRPLNDLLPNLAVNSMAIDPKDPNIIYAGTGEGYFNIGAVRGAGIFKSTDGGATWIHLTNTNNPDFHFVNDLVISPNNSERVYAATQTGVWRSTDGGMTWTPVLDPQVNGGCLDLAIRTDQPTDFMFAACGTFAQATIFQNRDADAGNNWTPVLTEPGMGRTALAIAPSDQNVMYAVSASIADGAFRHGLHAVFRSTSSGDPGTWTARVRNTNSIILNTVLLSNPVSALCGARVFTGQGWYDNVIAVDPLEPNRVWLGGIDLFRSDDGGANWGLASYWAFANAPQYAHADHHAVVFHPRYDGRNNRILFVANDGGVFQTTNALAPVATGPTAPCSLTGGGLNWRELNNNYGVTQFYHGAPFPNGRTYFGGTQDNGTVLGADQGGMNGWREILGGDGGYVAVDPNNTRILYAEMTLRRIFKSTDGGASFTPATNGIVDNRRLFIAAFIMDPSNSQRLWTGGQFLWRTSNGAAEWVRASAAISSEGAISAIAVAPTNPNNVLAGDTQGFIHRTNMGLTSTVTTMWLPVQPRAGFVSSVAFDPTNANIAYATYSTFGGTHVWKSTDAGATWVGIDGAGATGIPDIPVHSIIVNPANTSTLYIGTDLGVFVSTDGGQTWAVENTGFANVVTETLALTRAGDVLFAFTHGRGAWRVPLAGGQ